MQKSLCAMTAGLLVGSASAAQATVLTFEGVGSNARVDNFYNGGTDSAGNSGPNVGVSFTGGLIFSPTVLTGDTFQGAIDSDAGGGALIANEPSPNTTVILPGSIFGIMNVSAGFTSLSFFYSGFGGTVTLYDGLNGTGNVLGSSSFGSNFANGCSGDPTGDQFCSFDPVTASFAGTAKSARFQGSLDFFDNFNLSIVPEPGSWAMMLIGFGLIAAAMRRSAKVRLGLQAA